MRINADFLDFLKKGEVAGITLGATRSKGLDMWGMPPNWSGRGQKVAANEASGLYYGECLATFKENTLISITVGVHYRWSQFFNWINRFVLENQDIISFSKSLDDHGVTFQPLTGNKARVVLDAQVLTEGGVFVCVRRRVTSNLDSDGTYTSTRGEPVVDTFLLQDSEGWLGSVKNGVNYYAKK